MVQLLEIPDEHFQSAQQAAEENDDDYTDTDSEISTDSQYDVANETLAERLYALRDIIPATTRGYVSSKLTLAAGLTGRAFRLGGRVAWTVAVSALLVGVPFALAYGEDQTYAAAEAEERMRALGGELLTAGGGKGSGSGSGDAAADLQAQLAKSSGEKTTAQQPL